MTDEKKFEKQVAKEGYQDGNAEYQGLESKPMEWEKDGKKGIKVKTRWLIDGKEHPNKFIIWFPITSDKSKIKDFAELVQFEKYYIGWFEDNKEYEGREWVEKKIVVISDPSERIDNSQKQLAKELSQPIQKENVKTDIDNYVKAWIAEANTEVNLTEADFISNYYARVNPVACEYLSQQWKEIH